MIRAEEGATMVEYGLLVALIALVAVVGVSLLGTNLNLRFGIPRQARFNSGKAQQRRSQIFPQRVTKRNLPTLLSH